LFADVVKTNKELYPLFQQFLPAYKKINDYTATFQKKELVDGKWVEETLDFKFKKPFKVKIKWIAGPKKGQRAVFVEGDNDNKVLIKLGGVFGTIVPKLRLDPDGELAKDNSNRSIRQAGIGYMLNSIWEVTQQAFKNRDLSLKLIEEDSDSKLMKIERRVPPNKDYPNVRAVIIIDQSLGIPIGIETYDSKDRLKGSYYYEELNANINLSDDEFML